MGLFGKSKDDKPQKLTPKVLWEQYYRATQEQQWAGAVDALKQLARREPDNDKIPMKLGDALQRMGSTKEAVAAYHDAASATLASGFAQKALAIYKIILRLSPGDELARERSSEIVESIESGAQQQAAAAAVADTPAAPGGGAAFEGYGSLDMTPVEEEPAEPLEPLPMDEPTHYEPEPDVEPDPVPGLEPTALEEEPGGFSLMDNLVEPEPEPEVETMPGLEQTAYEDDSEEPAGVVTPVGLEPTMHEAEQDLMALSTPEEPAEPEAAVEPEAPQQEFRLPSVFSFLMPEEQEEFIARARLTPYAHGQSVIREGETGDSMYIIRQGTARVVTEIMGRQVELAQLGPGDFFGEVAFLTGRPRTASVEAVGEMELYEVDKPLLQETIDKNPLILDSLVELYHSRAQDTVDRIKSGRS